MIPRSSITLFFSKSVAGSPLLSIDNEEHLLLFAHGKTNQKKQQFMMCAYYAENFIRPRFGKGSLAAGRKIEIKHSTVRKNIDIAEDVYTELQNVVSKYKGESIEQLTELSKTVTTPHKLTKDNRHVPATIKAIKILVNEFKTKSHSCNDIRASLERIKKIQIKTAIDDILTPDENEEVKHQLAQQVMLREKINKHFLNEEQYRHVEDIAYFSFWSNKRFKEWGLKLSSWIPADGFDALLSSIKNHGEHVASGYFSQYDYANEMPSPVSTPLILIPGDSKKIADQCAAAKFPSHCIVLVGGNKKQKLLYYIDPACPSHNGLPEKYFAIAFDDFVHCLKATKTNRITEPVLIIPAYPYNFAIRNYNENFAFMNYAEDFKNEYKDGRPSPLKRFKLR